jgi:hypothetical protein
MYNNICTYIYIFGCFIVSGLADGGMSENIGEKREITPRIQGKNQICKKNRVCCIKNQS